MNNMFYKHLKRVVIQIPPGALDRRTPPARLLTALSLHWYYLRIRYYSITIESSSGLENSVRAWQEAPSLKVISLAPRMDVAQMQTSG